MRKRGVLLFCIIIFSIVCTAVLPVWADGEKVLAFPGAEGGGKYAMGARASENPEVYHVTTLESTGPGSLTEAVSKSNRIVVFAVGGTISYDKWKQLRIESNTTILGQTAPGEGITIEGTDLSDFAGKSNIIIRYLKIRPGDRLEKEVDGISMQYISDVIIDHCSVSWAVDELVSVYSGSSENQRYELGKNVTVQNCLMSEALNLSRHQKGEHGYGSIFGTDNSTLYHNVYAHNKSRNPAIYREIQNVNVANNVIYDWGGTASYGGQPHSINYLTFKPCTVNYVNNFYRWGPSSGAEVRNVFYNIENETPDISKSSFYFSGNVIDGVDTITNDNLIGVTNLNNAVILDKPIDLGEYEVPQETAFDTYNSILDTVGASIPKRDAIDAKVITDIKNGTGHIINSPKEVGGYINSEPVYRRFEISQDWKEKNGMGSYAESDIVSEGKWKGYTWIEAYVYNMDEMSGRPTNPDVVVQSPAIAANQDKVMGLTVDKGEWKVINEGESFNYSAVAFPKSGTQITKIELYDGDMLIDTVESDKIEVDIFPSSGVHYYTCRAYNGKNESANSATAIVCVNPAGVVPEEFKYEVLGTKWYKESAGASMDENGIITVGGSGRIKSKNSCGFLYRAVSGDFSAVVKVEDIPRYKDRIRAGLMLTDKPADNSKLAMISDNLDRMGENISIITRKVEKENIAQVYMRNKNGMEISNSNSDYNTQLDQYRIPEYLRIERRDNLIKFSVSDDGADWTNNPRQPYEIMFESLPETLYVGLGVESNPGTYPKPLYSMAKFSNFKIIEYNKLAETERWEIEDLRDNVVSISNKLNEGEITPDGKHINVYAAVYDDTESGCLLNQCAVGSFTTDKNLNKYDVQLDTGSGILDISKTKLFLWDDNMRPVQLFQQQDS